MYFTKYLLLSIFLLGSFYVISATPREVVIEADAAIYLINAQEAVEKNTLFSNWIYPVADRFIDYGYPFFLSLLIKLFGEGNIPAFQIANYALWFASASLIRRSIHLLTNLRTANIFGGLMLVSPVFLTFSAKLYSEPLACLGLSMMIYGAISYMQNPPSQPLKLLTYIAGGAIFFATKSVFLLSLVMVIALTVYYKKWGLLIATFFIPLIIQANILSANNGGRTIYNLAIQSSKLDLSYQELSACTLYYLSYPVGVKVAPGYQGICHQNDPNQTMSQYQANPYLLAIPQALNGEITTSQVALKILSNPVKYLYIITTSMATAVLFEGIYPSILLQLPIFTWPVLYFLLKIILSLTLWYFVFKSFKVSKLLILPILYFVFVVGNFPVEQRYFYPLIPFMYFAASLGYYKQVK